MSWLRRLFGVKSQAEPVSDPGEHAVLVHIPLSDDEFGAEEEREAIFALEDELIAAIEQTDAGVLDGNEFGGGQCVLFMYGPDADALWAAVEPLLREFAPARGGYAVKRYGPPQDEGAREERMQL
ncbi:MAG: hypothetical protein AB7Y46_01035 [Armatimonadota bacterium]